MKKSFLALASAMLSVLIVGVFGFVISNQARVAVGSVAQGNAYQSTTTRSTSASASVSWLACTGRAELGPVNVTQPGTAGYVQIWDATSTATSTYQRTDTSSTTITSVYTVGRPIAKVTGATDAFGSLDTDVSMTAGIVIETSTGFDGEYNILYRCYQ